VTHTSTTSPNWRTDCEIFLPLSNTFAITNVTTEEQMTFLKQMCERFDYRVSMAADIALLNREYCECECHYGGGMHFFPCCVVTPGSPHRVNYSWIKEHKARCQICRDAPERYEKYLLEFKQQLIHERASH
jgi:hypothetical protein